MRPFLSALALANLLYNIELSEDDFIEYALHAWDLIGNKTTRLYKYRAKIGCDLTVTLPCNCDILEAVTYDWEDWNRTTQIHNNGDINSASVEAYNESRKNYKDPLYISGKYAKFEKIGNKLVFNRDYGYVNILYKGVQLDEEGLPELSEKEIDAIATYVAYATKLKEALLTNNANIMLFANILKLDWQVKCDRARTPDYINLNELNLILDAKTNWDRHQFNKTNKIVR